MLSRTGNVVARVAPLALSRSFATRNVFNSLYVAKPVAQTVAGKLLRDHPVVARRQYTRRSIDEPAKVVEFDDVNKALTKKDDNLVLVDVREPDEFAQGHIPTAVNIPFRSSPGALGLDAAEFEDAFGFKKPATDKTLLFYCQGGVRCEGAEQLAATYGYQHRLNYSGSYQDWVDHKGDVEVPKAASEESSKAKASA